MSSARDQLLLALAQATSQEAAQIKAAETMLKQWETVPDFYITLLDIVYDKTVVQNVRFMGIIYFKNGLDRYWRKTAKNAIRSEEKMQIKSRLLSFMDEEINQLAAQNALLVSKIARSDYPNEWPDLLQNLLSIIHSTLGSQLDAHSALIQKRSLLTLHLVVKALCSRTFGPDRRMLEQIAPELLHNVGIIYVEHVNQLLGLISSGLDNLKMINELETSLLALKCIRRLIVHGFQDISEAHQAKILFELVFDHLQQFYNWRKSMEDGSSPIISLIEAHISLIGKLYIDLQKTHPIPFVLVPRSMDLLKYFWQILINDGSSYEADLSTKSPTFEKILVQGLLLLKGIIKKSAYNQNPRGLDKSKVTDAYSRVDTEFLTPDFVKICAETLISRFLVLMKSDLKMWEEDPEGWVNHLEDDHWEYQIRPCSEKLFMDLLSQYRQILSPLLIQMLRSVSSITEGKDLLLKDAVYSAVGLGAHALYDEFEFDDFLIHHLIMEAGNRNLSFKIIRRRIGWLIGQWISVKISKGVRSKVYEVMLHLMDPSEDLSAIIDEWDFEAISFAPYLESSITILTRMVGEVEQFDSRTKILNCLSLIVERMKDQIAPFAQQITTLLPPLWQASQGEHWFKPSILVILTKLVTALKEQSSNLQEFIIPLLQFNLNPNTEEHVYLSDDALDLWQAILQNTVECTPLLFSLVPTAISLLEFGSELLKKVLQVLESYIILVPEMLMQAYAHSILDVFTRLLGDLKVEACTAIVHVIDIILQACSIQFIGDFLITTGLLWKLLNILFEAEKHPFNIVSYISVFARIVVIDPTYFLRFIDVAVQKFNLPSLLEKVLDIWLERFDNIGHPKQRKLNAMAFTTLISTNNPVILVRLPQFINILCDVLSEIKEIGGGDALVYWQEDPRDNTEFENDEETAETKRRRLLLQRDPVHNTNMIQYIRQKLAECESLNGGPDVFRQLYINGIDPSLLDQLYGFLS
ncbi:hypothetical protein G9A89_004816 [Geosiphon pyriformis]|nr:hypothetical protein G9A89_004816 [Geosiphon pyriformis]